MMTTTVPKSEEDFASVSIDLPLSQNNIYSFIKEIDRLYRINPYLEIKSWKEIEKDEINSGKSINAELLNEMNGMHQALTLSLSEIEPGKSISIKYDSGIKQETIFSVVGITDTSCKLTIKELYLADLSETEKNARLNEVDKSLVPWGEAIHGYFARRRRWGKLPLFSWLQDQFWLGMPPRHRRIARLVLWTTVLEFVVFIFVFVIYWLELSRKLT